MTRLRFLLGLLGVPMAAQKQVTKGVNSPSVIAQGDVVISQLSSSVPRKPANGHCPQCSTSAIVDEDNNPMEVYDHEKSLLYDAWMVRAFETQVACRFCKTVFVVDTRERTDSK